MKHFYTLLAFLACALQIHAQKLSFQQEGKDIENGSVFITSKINAEFAAIGFTQFAPEIFIVSDTNAKNVTVKAESLDNKSIELCFAGSCKPGVAISSTGDLKANTPENINLHAGELMATTPQTCKVRLTAYYEGKENEAITIEVWMSNDENVLSTENIETKKDIVAVDGKTLHYSLCNAAKSIKIYTLTGSLQTTIPLKGNKEGNVSLSNLSSGLYLYLIEGGKRKAGKIQIQ